MATFPRPLCALRILCGERDLAPRQRLPRGRRLRPASAPVAAAKHPTGIAASVPDSGAARNQDKRGDAPVQLPPD
jgi:hypothetical protein